MTRAFTALCVGTILMLRFLVAAAAGTFEDAKAAFGRGDYATALQLYRSQANQGNAAAQYNLGSMYFIGKGVPKDQAKAAKWLRLAARSRRLMSPHEPKR